MYKHKMSRRAPIPVEVKLKIIKRVARGEKMGSLAEEYGIGRTTIHDIYKNRAKIQEWSENPVFRITKSTRMRRGKHPKVEEALYEWYLQEKKTGLPITGLILMTRAKEIYKEIFNTDEDFPATITWLVGFKRRYKVKLMQTDDDLNVEDNDIENPELEEFKCKFYKKIMDLELCPSQVYIATENELFWRVLPGDDLDVDLKKDKINFLSCANASGLHKLKLLIAGSFQKSYELKNISLPIHYFVQKITRITEESYKTWFDECFLVETRHWLTEHNLPPKALLLVDQALCQADDYTSHDGSVSVIFYPTECNHVMPLNEEVIKITKQRYKRQLLRVISSRDSSAEQCLKQYNMRDMVFNLAHSWQTLAAPTIAASWKEVWDNMLLDIVDPVEENYEETDLVLIRSIASEDMTFPMEALHKWFYGDDSSEYTEEKPSANNEMNDENMSITEAVSSFDKCIQWAEQSGSTYEDIAVLRKLRDKALIMTRYPETEFVDGGF